MKTTAHRAFFIFGIACVCYLLSFFHRVSPAVLAVDLMQEFALTPTSLSLLSMTTLTAYGLMQMPSGMISDMFGPRKTITVLLLGTTACGLWFAYSPTFSSIVASRFVMGMMVAFSVPCLALLAAWFPAGQYGRASSLLLACGGLGGVLAAPPLVLLSNLYGWRMPIVLFSGITFVCALATWFVVRDKPEDLAQKATRKPSVSVRESILFILRGAKQIFNTPAFYPPMLWIMCASGTYFAMNTLWWGPYFIQGWQFSKEETGVLISCAAFGMLFGQPLAGYLSDVVFKSRKKPVLYASVLGFVSSIPFMFCVGEIPFWLMLILTTLLAIGLSSSAPVLFANIKELFPIHLAGTAIGCGNMFFPLWGAGVQLVFGMVVEWGIASTGSAQTAYSYAAGILVISSLLSVGCAYKMTETFGTQKTA